MNKTAGFTLIELLVVISIIAILAAMLMPAIAMVRDAAKATNCKSNQRQFGLAFEGYTADNQGFYPGGAWQQGIQDFINADGKTPAIFDGTNTLIGYRPSRCPAAPAKNTSGFTLGVTYAYIGVYFKTWTWGNSSIYFFAWSYYLEDATTPRMHQGQIAMPSQKALLCEMWNNGDRQNWGISQLNDQSTRNLHRGRTNLLFVDGHTQAVPTTGALYSNVQWGSDPMWQPRVATASSRL